MLILKFALFIISVLLAGWSVTGLLFKNYKPLLAKLALSWALGAVLIPLELFIWFFVLRLKFNLAIFYLLLIVQIAGLLYLGNKPRPDFNLRKRWDDWRLKSAGWKFNLIKISPAKTVVAVLILIQIIFLSLNSLARPPIAYDNLAMWQYKPKVLFYENRINFDEEKYAYLGGGSNINYPWQAPLLTYWLYTNLGEFNDLAANLINLIYYLSILIIIYYFLKLYLSDLFSLIFVWLFSTMPLPFYHAYNGYAELTLSFYLLLAFIFLFDWFKSGEKNKLLAAGIFFGCALFVKNDALIFIIAGLLAILLKVLITEKKFMIALKAGGLYLLAAACPLLPWIFIKIKYGLTFSNVANNLGYHPEIWKSLYEALFLSSSFNIWWFVAIIGLSVSIIKMKRQKELIWSWAFFAFCFSGLIFLYLFTEEYRFVVDNTALSRNFLNLVPASIILTAVALFSPAKYQPQ